MNDKPKPRYDYLRAQAEHGRQIWPPMAQAKGVQKVASRKAGNVKVLGNAQALEVRQTGRLATFSRIRHVGTDGVARNPEGVANLLPRIERGIPVVERTALVREPTAQRQIVQAAAGHQPIAIAGRRLPAGVDVRMLGIANTAVPASKAFHKGGKYNVNNTGTGEGGIREGKAPQGATAGDATGGDGDGQPSPDTGEPGKAAGKKQTAATKEG